MVLRKKLLYLLLAVILSTFFTLFVFKSLNAMRSVPFNEFDEAHRAETAKRMKEYKSFLVPITGSVYDRLVSLRIQVKEDQFKFLYYHLERPPLVYDLMILSATVLGSTEFAYRLPSFLLGLTSFLIFVIFARKLSSKRINWTALVVALTCLLTSADIWLSSQYAQLDTGLTTFLFLACLSIIAYVEKKRERYLFISAIGLSLAILSKGQPAILFAPVVTFLLFTKRITRHDLVRFAFYTSLLLLPWLIYMSYRFSLGTFLGQFTSFAFVTSHQDIVHHKAPIFWYARWWWETLRPGWNLFLVLLTIDILRKNLNWKKLTLLSYIIFNFILFSIQADKLWWYVLPLVPAICFYIYLSLQDYLKEKHLLINLSLAIIIASRPSIPGISSTQAMLYGFFFLIVNLYLLYGTNISDIGNKLNKLTKFISSYSLIFICAIIFSLISFFIKFPKIIPYHWELKPVSQYFAKLPRRKCLWIYDIPSESVLFYSNTVEIYTYNSVSKTYGHCTNYLMTTATFPNLKLEHQEGSLRLYRLVYTP